MKIRERQVFLFPGNDSDLDDDTLEEVQAGVVEKLGNGDLLGGLVPESLKLVRKYFNL